MGMAFGLKTREDGVPDKKKLEKYALWNTAKERKNTTLSPDGESPSKKHHVSFRNAMAVGNYSSSFRQRIIKDAQPPEPEE
jgi:hypothetical protein